MEDYQHNGNGNEGDENTCKMIKKLKVMPLMSVEESDTWEGRMLIEADCKILITQDTDVYDLESGKCLAKFRKGVLSGSLCQLAYDNLLDAAKATDSRKVAGGKDEFTGKNSKMRLKKDGTYSKQSIANEFVNSGVVGFYDRSTRFPYCRLTAYTHHQMDKYKAAYPIFKAVDNYYASLMPKEYAAQRKLADETSKDFVIPGTSFTTVTVNKNYRTAVHKDAGDFKGGFGNLTALRKGKYTGCHLVLPRWGVGFDLQNQDLLLMDVHQWHGNTPMVKVDRGATRLSLVMYYREKMNKCGTAKQELKRVTNRKKGEPL